MRRCAFVNNWKMDLMDYEKEIFIDSFNNDGLLVMAK